MASLKQFTRRIFQRAEAIEKQASKGLRETALVVDRAVVLATPVDIGRARGNWIVGVNTRKESAVRTTDRGGGATIAAGESEIGKAEAGDTIHITNNLPYIVPLNNGSSIQASAGFAQRAIQQGANHARAFRLLDG